MNPSRTAQVESGASSPSKTTTVAAQPTESTCPSVGSVFHLKLEVVATVECKTADLSAAGNQNYLIELKDNGHIGSFFPRDRIIPQTFFPIQVNEFYTGIRKTLYEALKRLMKNKQDLRDANINVHAKDMAMNLANGCILVAFQKLRAISITDRPSARADVNIGRPKAAADLPIPAAFAFAIQQLGAVEIADLDRYVKVAPCFPDTGHKHGIPTNHAWNSYAYCQAMEFARNLGMQFLVVDLKVKIGSAWWLFEQSYQEDIFELHCPLPETNFTNSMCLAHLLFLNGCEDNMTNQFVDLTTLPGKGEFGLYLQSPPLGINVSAFEALSDRATDLEQRLVRSLPLLRYK